jgi:TonB family protein
MNKTSFQYSVLIHLLIFVFLFSIISIKEKAKLEIYEFSIIEKQAIEIKKKPKIIVNATKPTIKTKKVVKPVREVFGVSRKAQTDSESTVVVKKGNNLNKEEDDKILNKDDPDSLPQATEEFLITSMPRAINEIRPEYPRWAKEKKISGSVIFEILIDGRGDVRDAKLVKGLHPELDKLGLEAMLKFKFKPAYIEKETTAVRIKYAIRYVLED